ncbi:MAG: hypothetical protein V8R40_06920 [Dysosmobacter sp.]
MTVCGTLEKALGEITGERVHLTGCGRTDAGVHAEYYVANFRTESRIPLDRLPFAINTHTPEDIAVREALEVEEGFNAIGSCLKKEYTYRIYNSRSRIPSTSTGSTFIPSGWTRNSSTGRPICLWGPTISGRSVLWNGDKDHGPHHLLVRCDPERGSAGIEGLRQWIFV